MIKWRTVISFICAGAAGACLVVTGGNLTCQARSPVTVTETITRRVSGLEVGKSQTYGGLTVFPITGETVLGLTYLTLDEAMREKEVEIVESGSGTVNQVVIRNRSPRRVFIMDGEEIVGAKQNRVLNSSVLIGPKQTAKLPVSCVEQGRWVGESMEFKSGGTQLFARARQMNTPSVTANYAARPAEGARSNQGQVWANVARKRESLSIGDASGPMHEAYVKRAADVDGYVKRFHTVSGQVGAVFAINGEIVGADVFDQNSTLRRLFGKLVKSYALDAIERYGVNPAPTQGEAREFLRLVLDKNVSFRHYDSPGEGWDVRISSRSLHGSSLVAASRPVHIALFAPVEDAPVPMERGGIRPPSQRRLR